MSIRRFSPISFLSFPLVGNVAEIVPTGNKKGMLCQFMDDARGSGKYWEKCSEHQDVYDAVFRKDATEKATLTVPMPDSKGGSEPDNAGLSVKGAQVAKVQSPRPQGQDEKTPETEPPLLPSSLKYMSAKTQQCQTVAENALGELNLKPNDQLPLSEDEVKQAMGKLVEDSKSTFSGFFFVFFRNTEKLIQKLTSSVKDRSNKEEYCGSYSAVLCDQYLANAVWEKIYGPPSCSPFVWSHMKKNDILIPSELETQAKEEGGLLSLHVGVEDIMTVSAEMQNTDADSEPKNSKKLETLTQAIDAVARQLRRPKLSDGKSSEDSVSQTPFQFVFRVKYICFPQEEDSKDSDAFAAQMQKKLGESIQLHLIKDSESEDSEDACLAHLEKLRKLAEKPHSKSHSEKFDYIRNRFLRIGNIV